MEKNKPTVSNRRLTLYFTYPKTEFDLDVGMVDRPINDCGRTWIALSAIGTEIYEADIAMAREEQAMPAKSKNSVAVENTDVNPLRNYSYFELLAHDREKDALLNQI